MVNALYLMHYTKDIFLDKYIFKCTGIPSKINTFARMT